MVIDTALLRSKIFYKFRSQAEFGKSINWNKNKITAILHGKKVLNINECAEIAQTLALNQNEYCSIFLPFLSPNGDKNESA